MNYVGNYCIKGPSSTYNYILEGGALGTHVYQSGNYIDLNKNGSVDGANTGWAMFSGTYTQTNSPFSVPTATTESAATAYQRVVALAGAMPWRRDANDQRIARTVRQQYGTLVDFVGATNQPTEYITNAGVIGVRGWPALVSEAAPTDTDSDGMPDYWELAMGLNPNLATDRNLTNALTGYTRLEEYLNWLADAHALCDRNGTVDVNLRAATGGATNLTYTVASGTNGTVSLLGDGYTARFIATNDYSGLASFAFNATDPASSITLRPRYCWRSGDHHQRPQHAAHPRCHLKPHGRRRHDHHLHQLRLGHRRPAANPDLRPPRTGPPTRRSIRATAPLRGVRWSRKARPPTL